MKKSALAKPAVIAIALSLGGCFGGEDGEDNPADPGTNPKGSNRNKVSPGLYVGDYSPYDSNNILESEFTLDADGDYRFFWIYDNDAVGDLQGNWYQKDSSLYFNGVTESYLDGGLFYPGLPAENDTNELREITENSFVRKEWTPLRQKPYWVTYRKKSVTPLAEGVFRYSRDYVVDTATTSVVQISIGLSGKNLTFDQVERVQEDTLSAFEAKGTWYQLGSLLAIEGYMGRSFDTSVHAYTSNWDTLPGVLMQRIKDVSDTAFKMWTPAQMFSAGSWEVYQKD